MKSVKKSKSERIKRKGRTFIVAAALISVLCFNYLLSPTGQTMLE
ncbi:hypothetical protein ACSVDA_14395 [Cytobacillus sp. Hm23]